MAERKRNKAVISNGRELKQLKEEIDALRAQLQKIHEETETFASVASHDLQEPLRTIISYLGLIKMKYGKQLDSEAHEFFDYALTGSERLSQMLRDLLVYSRVHTRGGSVRVFSLQELLDEVCRHLSKKIEETGAHIHFSELPEIRADRLQMSQVLQSLIGNALKFRSEKTPGIWISAEKKKKHWLISVRDNGIGFDPAQSEKIFSAFKRLHNKDKYPGSGMGLAICKKIVERHGGEIKAESKPGEGSVFSFTIPDKIDILSGHPRFN